MRDRASRARANGMVGIDGNILNKYYFLILTWPLGCATDPGDDTAS
jgi:hypothetical protein